MKNVSRRAVVKLRTLKKPPARITSRFATAMPATGYEDDVTEHIELPVGGVTSRITVCWSAMQMLSNRPFGAVMSCGPSPWTWNSASLMPQNVVPLSQSTNSPVKLM